MFVHLFGKIDAGWAAVVLAALIAVIQAVRYIFKKIFKLGEISNRLGSVETSIKDLKKELSKSAGELNTSVGSILKMLAEKGLSHSNSPRVLSEDGRKVLTDSGIDAIVDDKFDLIVKRVKKLKPENPYQAEIATMDVVAEFKNDPVLKDAIEEGAFNSGYFVDSVLFVGGLYIRDRVLKELGMKADEIDKHKPNQGKQ